MSGVSASQRGDARQFPVPQTRPEAALCPQQGYHSHRSSRSLWACIGETNRQRGSRPEVRHPLHHRGKLPPPWHCASGLPVIALWLGHADPATTHQYIEADLQMKEVALKRLQPPPGKARPLQADYRASAIPRQSLIMQSRNLRTGLLSKSIHGEPLHNPQLCIVGIMPRFA